MIGAENWQLEQRGDGAVVVHVPSSGTYGRRLPDAVFAFRIGDPQYDFWQRQLMQRRQRTPQTAAVS